MYATSAVMSMTLQLVTLKTVLPPVQHLKTCPKTGYAPSVA